MRAKAEMWARFVISASLMNRPSRIYSATALGEFFAWDLGGVQALLRAMLKVRSSRPLVSIVKATVSAQIVLRSCIVGLIRCLAIDWGPGVCLQGRDIDLRCGTLSMEGCSAKLRRRRSRTYGSTR